MTTELREDWRSRRRGPVDQARRGGQARTSSEAQLVASQLRRARFDADMTQAEVAQAAGLAKQQVADIEAGRIEPSIGRAIRFAKAVGLRLIETYED